MIVVGIGTDLTFIPKIEKLLKDESATKRVFHPSELKDTRPEHLAGVFAAKEAFFKALKKVPDWLAVEVVTKENGEPELRLMENGDYGNPNLKPMLSISHDGDYALAVVILTVKK